MSKGMDRSGVKLRVVYEPTGPAREYAPLACNLYRGCTGQCAYCYGPACVHRPSAEFHADSIMRPGVLAKLALDCRDLQASGDQREIFLCFTCDPWPLHDSIAAEALEVLALYGRRVRTLTKVPSRCGALEWRLIREHGWPFGVSVCWSSNEAAAEWEPQTDPPLMRLAALINARYNGCKTWASVEPVLDPKQALECIEALVPHCDEIRVGKLNARSCRGLRAAELREIERGIDWPAFRERAVAMLEKSGVRYMVKHDLAEAVRREWPKGVRE